MEKQAINLVWLKRDIRCRDHAALAAAAAAPNPCFIFYCFEPSLEEHPDYALRHWRFAYESLQDLQSQLTPFKLQVYLLHQEVLAVLQLLQKHFHIKQLFSHLEVGVKATFDRDKVIKGFCKTNQIQYHEFGQDGIIRGQKHRDGWQAGVEKLFHSPPLSVKLNAIKNVQLSPDLHTQLVGNPLKQAYLTPNRNFQPGGSRFADRYLGSFLLDRHQNYSRQLSKPSLSRTSCSRISPYLAFGNISVREVFQKTLAQRQNTSESFNLPNFQSRLYWRSHYLQKLESGHYLEFEPINPALKYLNRSQDPQKWHAFKTAQTGFPMVDASLRCLAATGWVNFRMRAMLVTFTAYALWLDWRLVAHHLANLFLDFEPGIHYPQIQMQAGLTGYHTLRIFNPNIQAEQHDSTGQFIHRWIPELSNVPAPLCHRPWQMTILDQQFYHCRIGKDYPHPIVNYDEATRKYKAIYWKHRQHPSVKQQLPKVWRQFCVLDDIKKYKQELL